MKPDYMTQEHWDEFSLRDKWKLICGNTGLYKLGIGPLRRLLSPMWCFRAEPDPPPKTLEQIEAELEQRALNAAKVLNEGARLAFIAAMPPRYRDDLDRSMLARIEKKLSYDFKILVNGI